MAYQPLTTLGDVMIALRNLFHAITRPIWYDSTSNNALRVNVVTGATIATVSTVTAVTTLSTVTTVTTVTTVATVTSLSQLSGFSTRDNVISPLERSNWATCVRNRIT